ncbi:MAG: helix-turn-helix domain-containing protein [Acidobacteriales bacterium]|nr:helix-turn-helix domain-containing protein [Terriglobales bacterium]
MFEKTFRKLKAALVRRGLTESATARAIGVSAPTFSRFMHGQRKLDLDERRRLAELLGVDADTPHGSARLRRLLPARRRRERTRKGQRRRPRD